MKRALVSLGYRRIPGPPEIEKWGKPIGHTILVFDPKANYLVQHFYTRTGELAIWDSAQFEYRPENPGTKGQQFESFVKQFEAWSLKSFDNLDPSGRSFSFITMTETITIDMETP